MNTTSQTPNSALNIKIHLTSDSRVLSIDEQVRQSFKVIAPFWPLKNLIAVNPLQGLEELSFEEALTNGAHFFQKTEYPKPIEAINRESIKWLQPFFDEGQATLKMPLRRLGLYRAWKELAKHDYKLHQGNKDLIRWLSSLPEDPEQTIEEVLSKLEVNSEDGVLFLTLLLTTLPGWAGHVKYRTEWAGLNAHHPYPVTQTDYLAFRIVIAYSLWPDAKLLLTWHKESAAYEITKNSFLSELENREEEYRNTLLEALSRQNNEKKQQANAQLVFCIDVRSEPFRRALESTGAYETFGFAGFFGVPAQITDTVTGETYASCPVLLTPQHEVKTGCCSEEAHQNALKGFNRLKSLKTLYQSVKYTFSSPFALVEGMGLLSGSWMGIRALSPAIASQLKAAFVNTIRQPHPTEPSLNEISEEAQCRYAEGALKMMGLTEDFAQLVVFCGHGSATENNAFATALDCGACGGHHGGQNGQILAAILNRTEVRAYLAEKGIEIPSTTSFVAAEHNTTTDEVHIFGTPDLPGIDSLKNDLEKARQLNSSRRLQQMGEKENSSRAASKTLLRALDWSQVRPEWGLARNAAFIIAPRDLTESIDLDGRSFLHSYDYQKDPEGASLTVILTAPMVVAEWINMQYFFSAYDNIAYGAGSKVTKNITGKIGIMQGNSSDLMTGLPLQSVYKNDRDAYHEPQRLLTVVYAPPQMIAEIVKKQEVLQKLFGNGWVQLACIDPESKSVYLMARNFSWKKWQ